MAVATIETIVANPARKRRHNRMAKRHMTLKQRLHFGSARQRAAARASMKRKRRHNAAKPTKRRRHATRSRPRRRRTHNPGEIIAMTLGNPARKKGRKRMAATKRRRRHASKHNAGRRRHRTNARRRRHNPARRHYTRHHAVARRRHHSRRHNPAGVRWTDVFVLGGGALVGSTLSSAGTQLLLQSNNTGPVGYAANLVATLILSWLGGMVTRNKAFPAGILAGGVGALMKRIISDYSLFGGYTSQLGMGDYLVSNWVAPQRLSSDFRSLTDSYFGPAQGTQFPPGISISSSGVSTRGMGLEGDPTSVGTAGY